MVFESKHKVRDKLHEVGNAPATKKEVADLQSQVWSNSTNLRQLTANTEHIDPISVRSGAITTSILKLGHTAVEVDQPVTCPIHGDDVGISITAEANKTTPTMKLVACRFCMLEKLAKGM